MAEGWPHNPFVGLRPFRSDEALLFFGRRQQTMELLTRLHNTHFVAVVGSSGCGKSSLIQAGLIPGLTAGFLVEDRDLWMFRTLTPGDAPRARLAEAFEIPEDAIREQGAPAVVGRLSQQPDAASRNCLLVVDQFEEIFSFTDSMARRDEAADFVDVMLALATQRDFPVFVVMTMRSDFLGDCDVFHGFPEALNQSQYLVPRLPRPARQEVIAGPVRLFGQTITPRLVDRLLNDLGDDQDQLPVMQHALLRTWERWQREGGSGPVDVPHYLAVGGVREALARDADAALAGMSESERQLAARIFQALTDTDLNSRPVRRYVRLSRLERETGAPRGVIEPVLERFRESGRSFLVVRKDPASDDASVHISHESLIRQWSSLAQWVSEEKHSRDRYLRLADLARRHARGEEGLLRDPGLQLALDWRDARRPAAPWAERYGGDFELAMSYLSQSEAQREKERREKEAQQQLQLQLAEERGHRKAQALLIRLAFVFGFVGLAIAAVAFYQWRNAAQQKNAADSNRIALDARSQAERNLDLAMLLGVAAFDTAATFEARSSLLTVIGRNIHPGRFLHGHTGVVRSVAFAPDGKFLASAGQQEIILWEPEGRLVRRIETRGAETQSVAFSPDGRLLAAGSRDGTVALWNAGTGELAKTLGASQRDVRSIAFSRDGQHLAASDFDGSIVVWDLRGEPRSTALIQHIGPQMAKNKVLSVTFSPDGMLLASGHGDGSVALWDMKTNTRTRELRKHTAEVTTLAFGPDGGLLVSGSDDKTILAWDLRNKKATEPIASISRPRAVRSVAIGADGTLLAAGSDDSAISLWRIVREESTIFQSMGSPLKGHGSVVQSVAFSPDGKRLASGGLDNKVILWDLTVENLVDVRVQDPHKRAVRALDWKPDGKSLAWLSDPGGGGAGPDDAAKASVWDFGRNTYEPGARSVPRGRIVDLAVERDGGLVWSGLQGPDLSTWDVQRNQKIGPVSQVPGGESAVGLAVSAGRTRLAYGTEKGEIVLWDLSKGLGVRTFENGGVRAESLAFSADGTVLAAGRGNESVVLWNLETGQELGRLTGPEGTVSALAFSQDGNRFVAAATLLDYKILIWDLTLRRHAVLLTGHRRDILSLSFSPDGERLASGDAEGTIRVWNLGGDALRRHACRAANRALSQDEWIVNIGPDTPYREACKDEGSSAAR